MVWLHLAACSPKQPPVIEALYSRLDAIHAVLQKHAGNQEAAVAGLWALYQERSSEILDYRANINAAVEGLSAREADAYKKGLEERRARIENLARGFHDPPAVLKPIATML